MPNAAVADGHLIRARDRRTDWRVGAFAETLARFCPDLGVAAELERIDADPEVADHSATIAPGVVPWEWLDARVMGRAAHCGWFVDVGYSDALAVLRRALARPGAALRL